MMQGSDYNRPYKLEFDYNSKFLFILLQVYVYWSTTCRINTHGKVNKENDEWKIVCLLLHPVYL